MSKTTFKPAQDITAFELATIIAASGITLDSKIVEALRESKCPSATRHFAEAGQRAEFIG